MTYLPHWRATFKGDFRVGAGGVAYEQWSTSMAFNFGTHSFATQGQEAVNDMRDDFSAFVTAANNGWASNTYFTEVRLDSIGPDGKIDQDAVFAPVAGTGVTGAGTASLPPSCAVVLTLDTKLRGRSRYGRMYLPLLGVAVGADGRMTAQYQTSTLNNGKTLVEALSNFPNLDTGFEGVIASGVGAGSLNPIKQVRVGRVVDTMRSRRRSMNEDYASVAVSV